MAPDEVRRQVEAVLFASSQPVASRRLAQVLGVPEELVLGAILELRHKYGSDSGILLKEVAGGWQFFTRPEYAHVVARIASGKKVSLSRGALETLAIIAYNQPITRAEIESLRGVNCQASLDVLLERGLIQEVGRKKSLGRPILYGTTGEFLKALRISSLDELPPVNPEEPDRAPKLFPTP